MRKLISLGYRCDIAFQLRLHGADNTAHFFDWLATPAEGLITIFDRNFDVFHADQLQHRPGEPSDCVVDRITGTLFWHQFPIAGGRIPAEFLLFHPQFHAKFAYLAQRFRDTVMRDGVTLVRDGITAAEAERMEDSFYRRFPGADATFLYIVNKPEARFYTRTGRAVVLEATGRSLGDPAAWAQMLEEQGLIKQPYRRSTVEILGHDHDDYNMSQDHRFTEDELLAAIGHNPTSAMLLAELGQFYLVRQRLEDASARYTAALALHPDPDWQIDRIVADWRLDRLSIPDAIDAVSRLPGPVNIYQRHEYVRLLLAGGHAAAARAICAAFLSRTPRDETLSRAKAEACLTLGRKLEAEAAIDHALTLGPTNWRHHLLRSDILAALERPVQARKAARTALDLDDNPDTRAALKRFAARTAA